MTRRQFSSRVVIVALVASATIVEAQSGRPKATVTPAAEAVTARAGSEVRLSLNVTLPNDVHVQSDKPRDESLIPTVVTVDAPAGVSVSAIEYPAPTDLAQVGQKEPLAVFGPTFAITVRLALAKDLAAGDVTIPARLRYQACDAKACYPPARADTQWVVQVK